MVNVCEQEIGESPKMCCMGAEIGRSQVRGKLPLNNHVVGNDWSGWSITGGRNLAESPISSGMEQSSASCTCCCSWGESLKPVTCSHCQSSKELPGKVNKKNHQRTLIKKSFQKQDFTEL